jgi:hypothetical protein
VGQTKASELEFYSYLWWRNQFGKQPNGYDIRAWDGLNLRVRVDGPFILASWIATISSFVRYSFDVPIDEVTQNLNFIQ